MFLKKNNNTSNTLNEINSKNWSDAYKKKAIQVYEDFKKEGLEVSSHFVTRFLKKNNKNVTQKEVIEMYKKFPINYEEIVPDKNAPNGYKINNVRYYNNIRVITNENDTELITVVEDKNNQALQKVNDNVWREKNDI